ncbi:hypothetical protein HispidOSU_000059 [Sigmodon hispidus]
MEASIQLMQVIQEMRAEINRLEKENHTLRVKLTSVIQTASGSRRESEDDGQSPEALPGGIPTDSTPAVQEQGSPGNVMIVRRYSISPPVHSCAENVPWKARNRCPNIIGTSLAHSSASNQDNEEKILAANGSTSKSSSKRGSSHHNFLCR